MPTVRIRYCLVWNYKPRAARVAALVKDRLGLETELVAGDRGEFTVWVGDERVAQKTADGFPTDQEAVAAVQRAVG